MSGAKPRVLVLGAGPAGLGAAYVLARDARADVTVIERNDVVGGNAGSFPLADMYVDYGSHRLHPASDPQILDDVHRLLGDDLLDRPRHGRIRLLGRWIHFPLKPIDLGLRLPLSFSAGVAVDMATKPFRGDAARSDDATFGSILERKLGGTIANRFYLPYARKLWGLDPTELSPIQARRRVSADSPAKLIKKVMRSVPGFKPPGAGRFFYPRRGFGQICEAYRDAATAAGATIELGARVVRLDRADDRPFTLTCERAGETSTFAADHVWSTIPITRLVQCLDPAAPDEVVAASRRIEYRAMLLIYLVVGVPSYTEYDAHYFPEPELEVTRISEPKHYADRREPADRTVLCAELPCATTDPAWEMKDDDLGALVADCLARAGLPRPQPILEVTTRRLPQAYPIYRIGYEESFERMDAWLGTVPRLLSFGRQGLFAHDNTHHALYMAYAAASCLGPDGSFDRARWAAHRREFESHVVED